MLRRSTSSAAVLDERADARTERQSFLAEPFREPWLQLPSTLWRYKPALEQDRPELVDQGSSLTDEPVAYPMHPPQTGKDQTTDDRQSPLAAPREGRLTSKPDEPEPPLLKPATCPKLSDDG